ncbi:MAG: hypothetical protein Q4G63_11365 [Bacteroidia bacterium]|nr:hypothetical protein [Bacteroidia bacterium]
MTLFQQIDRINYIDSLIRAKRTGSPDVFSRKLRLSKRQLFNILEELRIEGLDIQYCRYRETYYYRGNKVLHISFVFQDLTEIEEKNTFAGKFISECNFISLYPSNFAM